MSKRVFILEDEPIIAIELESSLTESGFEVVGVAGTVEQALEALEKADCNIAILDANLRGETSAPVAACLARAGTPFLFVSGYERGALPAEFASAPLLAKPFETSALVSAINKVLGG